MTTPHSITEFTDPEVSPANNRAATVSYASRYPDYSRIPAITLKGQWLEVAGFTTGTQVDVKVMNGCIVLTAQQPQPEESELMQSLRQVCKLSARKQKQVQAFISVIADKSCKQEA
ncbi:endoribonuclease SymE [Salmonella enterica]|nr:endoribonuclease SymE [Salmonella enterica]EJJ4245359.1 endoribonuclease SymE [Salmonella enterica]